MISNSLPSPFHFCRMSTHSLPLLSAPRFAHTSLPKMKFHTVNLSQVLQYRKAASLLMRTDNTVGTCAPNDSDRPTEENTALDTVLKLYAAIKNKDADYLSDVIAEECLCCSNFIAAYRLFRGKKQVLDFFYSLMRQLGNNIELVVQPTLEDGMVVGVTWKLEWNKVPVSLGKGFGFHMCHTYQGKVMIKNVEIFMEPLLHMELLILKLISLSMAAMEKLDPQALFKNNQRRIMTCALFALLLVATLLHLKFKQ